MAYSERQSTKQILTVSEKVENLDTALEDNYQFGKIVSLTSAVTSTL